MSDDIGQFSTSYFNSDFLHFLHLAVFPSLYRFHKAAIIFALSLFFIFVCAMTTVGVLNQLDTPSLIFFAIGFFLATILYWFCLFSGPGKQYVINSFFSNQQKLW